MKIVNIIIVSTLLGLTACNQGQNQKETSGESAQNQEPANSNQPSYQKGSMEDFNTGVFQEVFNKPINEKNGFYRIAFPRSDLQLNLEGVNLETGFSHTSWMAYLPLENGEAKMMGDMVLPDEEIENVLPVIRENDIQVTAIHNHLAKENPTLKYMHIGAIGKPGDIARSMKKVYQATALPLDQPAGGGASETAEWGDVEEIMGKEGSKSGKLLKFGFPRQESIEMHGLELPPTFGIATAINFQKINETDAVVTGDFVMKAEEVNKIMQTITEHGITSTALHNHMLHEDPRLFYMHFWGKGNAEELATGLRAALDKGNY